MQDMPFAAEEIVFQHDRDPKRTVKLFSFLIFHNSKKHHLSYDGIPLDNHLYLTNKTK